MLNPFVIKKYAGLLIHGFISVFTFLIGIMYYGLWGGILFMIPGMLLGIVLAIKVFLDHPFRKMLEGRGIMVFPLDSSGIIQPFIMNINLPFIHGKYKGKEVDDVFNRETVFNLAPPIELTDNIKIEDKEDGSKDLIIKISEENFNPARFQLNQYPLFIYNQNLNSVLTKEMLSNLENTAFAEHTILNLNRKVQELGRWIRDFARYAIEQMRPKQAINVGKIAFWLIIVGLIVLLVVFFPDIMQVLGGAGQSAGAAFGNAGKAMNTITPV